MASRTWIRRIRAARLAFCTRRFRPASRTWSSLVRVIAPGPLPAAWPHLVRTPGAGCGPAPPPGEPPRTGRRSGAAESPVTTPHDTACPPCQDHMTSLAPVNRFYYLRHAEHGDSSHPCGETAASLALFRGLVIPQAGRSVSWPRASSRNTRRKASSRHQRGYTTRIRSSSSHA
jgi:hypothetical protein